MGAFSYFSERSYACLAEDAVDPSSYDRGMSPFLLLTRLKAAHDALGRRDSLDGVTEAARLLTAGLKDVRQPYEQQFGLYSIPDDMAEDLDCQSQLTLGRPEKVRRKYGDYFEVVFSISGSRKAETVAVLWGKDNGYWKIVSWQSFRFVTEEGEPPVLQAIWTRENGEWRISGYDVEMP
jgi:hypothetical protein